MNEHSITLASGKAIRARHGIVGIAPDMQVIALDQATEAPGEDRLTAAQMIELADIMIARWTALKARVATRSNRIKG